MNVFFWNKKYSSEANVHNLCDIERVLNNIHEKKLCSGGPRCTEYNDVTPRCAYKDFYGSWRHNLCTLSVLEGEASCKHCFSLHNTLLIHANRKAKREESQRIHFGSSLTPTRKKNIEIMRHAYRKQCQALKRTQLSLNNFKKQVRKTMHEISNMEEKMLDKKLEDTLKDPMQVIIKNS